MEEKASGSLPLSSQESKQCCASADWSPLLPFAALRITSLSRSLGGGVEGQSCRDVNDGMLKSTFFSLKHSHTHCMSSLCFSLRYACTGCLCLTIITMQCSGFAFVYLYHAFFFNFYDITMSNYVQIRNTVSEIKKGCM